MSPPPARLRFIGATRTVTGSRFLIEDRGQRLLIDCGLYQGARDLRRRNWAPFPVPAGSIDAVVLSHAHLDHCGWLPRLVRAGFAGSVLCSPWTAEVAPIVLRDAAHLQEEDAADAADRGYSRHCPPEPLFDMADAEKTIALLRPVEVGVTHQLGSATVTLRRAGHILGSTTVHAGLSTGSVAFSGDLGRPDHPLLNPPDPPPAADVMVVESTYGDRRHPVRRLEALGDPIRRTLERGGVALVPAFAIDRTPVLLMALRALMQSGRVPAVPVFVDSPMALAALELYRAAVRADDGEVRADVRAAPGDPFDPGDLRLARSAEESKRLNDPPRPCVLISAAGMATGGRVVHHLAALLPDPRNCVILPGFQVAGTRGRALLDGATAVKMFGGYVPVRAEIVGVDEFSAHADADGLVAWLRAAPRAPHTTFVVHGEEPASVALARRIGTDLGWCAVVPRSGEHVVVNSEVETRDANRRQHGHAPPGPALAATTGNPPSVPYQRYRNRGDRAAKPEWKTVARATVAS
jgi:metallo-beta-lactamase family protein